MLKGLMAMVMPRIAKAMGIKAYDRESLEFFADIFKQTVESRKGKKKRNGDMVDLLTKALRGEVEEETDAELQLEVAKPRGRIPSIPDDLGGVFHGVFSLSLLDK